MPLLSMLLWLLTVYVRSRSHQSFASIRRDRSLISRPSARFVSVRVETKVLGCRNGRLLPGSGGYVYGRVAVSMRWAIQSVASNLYDDCDVG